METRQRILVVDDEPEITLVLRSGLTKHGYDVRVANEGEAALELFQAWTPDLVVTDLSMPNMNGLQLCRRLRAISPVPIIVLSVKSDEAAKVEALDLGADDYVTKPFSIRELMARVKAVLRRISTQSAPSEIYRFSDVEVNVRSNQVLRNGAPIDLSAKEFALLAYFVAHPAETLSRDRLLDAVWGYDNYPNTRTVDTHIVHLRQKLEPNPEEPRFILTVHGTGYKFVG